MTIKRKPGNPRRGRTVSGSTIYLNEDRWEKAKRIGGGRKSKGIAKALDNHKEDEK